LYKELPNGQILKEVKPGEWHHFCMSKKVDASYSSGMLFIQIRKANIQGEIWDGTEVAEDGEARITIDEEDAGTAQVTAGKGSIELSLPAGATYKVVIYFKDYDPAEIEVTV